MTFKFCDLVFMTGLLPRHGNVQRGRAPEHVRPLMECSQEGELGATTLVLCDAENEGTRNRSVAACPLWVKSRHFVVQSFVHFTLESGTSDAMIGPGAHSQINLECGWFNVRFNPESRLSSC